jgi:hypothetical protein
MSFSFPFGSLSSLSSSLSSSSSGYAGIDVYAGWKDQPSCDCPARFWQTVKIEWEEVPMWPYLPEVNIKII